MEPRLAAHRWPENVEVKAGGEFAASGVSFYRRRRSKKNARKREE
jgi:hypothetical protein